MALILALALAPGSVLPALGVAATAADLDPSAVGPHGGRLLQSKPLATEYVVADDRKVEVYFFDKDMKPAPPREALVQLQAEAPSGIVALELEKAGDHLASREPLPGNPPHRLIVELRASPEAEPMILRIVVQPVGGKVPLIPTP